MGLGAPKRRNKLSQDPNNTAWSTSTTGFGHRILSKQGWKQGDFLGAENANHSEHYTAANASHIRVLLREDNLGIGAKLGKSGAETFGLSLFSGVLGRLNGKSDVEVQKQQESLRDAELRTYQVQKYGLMNFVRGGLLVGDKIEPFKVVPYSTAVKDSGKQSATKRKADQSENNDEASRETKKIKKSKSVSTSQEEGAVSKKHKKARERGQGRAKKPEPVSDTAEEEDSADTSDDGGELKTTQRKGQKSRREDCTDSKDILPEHDRAESKAERRARKEARRKRKEQKRRDKELKTQETLTESAAETPNTSHSSTPQPGSSFGGSRHAVRQRYIQQKRMASMNAQAIKEIFMMKASA